MTDAEGVVKHKILFTPKPPVPEEMITELNHWRAMLYWVKLIGQNSEMYLGKGYGNVSMRLPPYNSQKGKKRFLVTGTQTGKLERLTAQHYSTVLEYYPDKNLIVAEGPVEPSSEAMSHGAIYDGYDAARFVFHAHSPMTWVAAGLLGLPSTSAHAAYGTPEMAEEIARLLRETDALDRRIIVMLGHKDGVISFGRTAMEAGMVILECPEKAYALQRS
jgi:ribulose-5-phosphate 4-epimerase/fuculose-1-phosphate aldolase